MLINVSSTIATIGHLARLKLEEARRQSVGCRRVSLLSSVNVEEVADAVTEYSEEGDW
jgi:hypothetical protein